MKKILYGVWLSNHTDRRDDEWIGVMANSPAEAEKLARYEHDRFSIDRILPAKQFCKHYDIPRSFLTAVGKFFSVPTKKP